jgi:hypothetical protein
MSVLPLLGLRTIVCITSAITRDFMLAAAANGKLKRRRDYLEDEITSIFFGGLQLLPIKTIWSLFAKIAKQANIHSDAFSSSPTSANFEYWPRFDNIEPDLVINFKQDGRPLINIIVEVKWNSPLSPKCELVKQWSSRPKKSEEWIHLYITKQTSSRNFQDIKNSIDIAKSGLCDKPENCQQPKCFSHPTNAFSSWKQGKKLAAITWPEIIAISKSVLENNDPTLKGIEIFFQKQGIHLFNGFSLPDELNDFVYQQPAPDFYPLSENC